MADQSVPPNTQAILIQAAAAGGALWAMAKIFSVAFAPVPARKRDILRACVESAFAMISALIGGRFIAPAIARARGWHEAETLTLLGLIVGLICWQAIPLMIAGGLMFAKNFMRGWRAFTGVAIPAEAPHE